MNKAGSRILGGAREALAVAKGEAPAASITVNGHRYVPAALVAKARADAIEECATVAETAPPLREIISEEKWVDMTDDYGELIGQVKQGERFRLNYRKGCAAAIRRIKPSEAEGRTE